MTEDADLTEFLDGGDTEANEETSDGAGESGEASDPDGAVATDGAASAATGGGETAECGSPDPATVTSAWTAGGAVCEACGETARRRWRDDGRLVCADCTAW